MSNKAKGSKNERELLKIFKENNWRAVRVAGSGINDDSPCDILAAKLGKKGFAIECKSSRKDRIYISKEQIEDFLLFSSIMGFKPVIAVRFIKEGWLFLEINHLEDCGKNYVISYENAKTKGKKFGQFFEQVSNL